jgi:hypothetical protein
MASNFNDAVRNVLRQCGLPDNAYAGLTAPARAERRETCPLILALPLPVLFSCKHFKNGPQSK